MRNVLLVASEDIAWPTLRRMLRGMPDAEVLGEAFNAQEALDVILGSTPDVIVAPAQLRGQSSIALVRLLHERCPQAAIVVVGSGFRAGELADLAQAGVRSYLLWNEMDIELLQRCLHVAIFGDVMIGSLTVGQAFFEAMRGRSSIGVVTQLTPREQSVLSLLAEDLSDKEIAASLDISPSTVGSHIQNLCAKLGARTRFGLAISAVTKGLIPTG